MTTSLGVQCVFDASCLIAFARTGTVDLLIGTFAGRAYCSHHVRIELENGDDDKPDVAVIRADEWLPWRSLDTSEELSTYADTLKYVGPKGKGDAATISLARHSGHTAVLDDRVARKRAEALGIPHVGTLGIVADFVVTGTLTTDAAWALLEDMISEEFRLKVPRDRFVEIVEKRSTG